MTSPVFTCTKIYDQLLIQLKLKANKKNNLKAKKKKELFTKIFTKSRNSTLLPFCVGSTFIVHNGKTFIKVYISENIVNHKLGEFSNTRQRYFFKKKKGKVKK
jgi:ribosomal protein S19